MSNGTTGSEVFRGDAPEPASLDAGQAVEVRRGRGIGGLTALRHDWMTLAGSRPDAGFQHQYGWYLSYLNHLEADPATVYFFSFFRNGRPIAIFPLRRMQRRIAGIDLWQWELPSSPHMNLCDCPLARNEDGAALMRLLIATLKGQTELPWDVLHFHNVASHAAVLAALRAAALPRTRFMRIGSSMYFPCADMETAMRNVAGKFKRNLRRQRRKLERRGRVDVVQIEGRAGLEPALEAFLELEASGWKGRDGRGSAIRLHPHLVRYYREIMEQFSAHHRCCINLLELNGTVIAGQFGVIVGSTLYLLKIAYDEKYNAEAPGNQLMYEVLRASCDAAAITRVSLVTGPAWATGRWNPAADDVWSADVFNATARGLAAYAATRLKSALGRAAPSTASASPLAPTAAAGVAAACCGTPTGRHLAT